MDQNEHSSEADLVNNKLKRSRNNNQTDMSNEQNLTSKSLRLSFIEINDSFSNIDWKNVRLILNAASNSWKFVAFSNDNKSVIFAEENNVAFIHFQTLTFIEIEERRINIRIQEVIGNSPRGIIYKKFLIPKSKNDLLEILKPQGISDLFKIQKINPFNQEKFDSGSVILLFEVNAVVSSVIIEDVKLFVNKLKPRPLLCDHCGFIGHNRKKCKKLNISYCKICFTLHEASETCDRFCKNCSGLHSVGDKNCDAILNEIKILKVKEFHNISYFDAKEIVQNSSASLNHNDISDSDRESLRNRNVKKIQEEFLKLTVDLRLSREREAEAIFKAEQSNSEVEKFVKIIVPELNMQLEQQKIAYEDKLDEKNNEFTDLMKSNMLELTNLSNLNTAFNTQLEETKANYMLLNKKYQICLEEKEDQTKFFNEFVDSSNDVRAAYKKFTSSKKSVKIDGRKPIQFST